MGSFNLTFLFKNSRCQEMKLFHTKKWKLVTTKSPTHRMILSLIYAIGWRTASKWHWMASFYYLLARSKSGRSKRHMTHNNVIFSVDDNTGDHGESNLLPFSALKVAKRWFPRFVSTIACGVTRTNEIKLNVKDGLFILLIGTIW